MNRHAIVETVTLRPTNPAFSRGDVVIFGVLAMICAPAPRMLLAAHVGGADLPPVWLSLGDTAEFGGTTWRFEDVHFANPDSWLATLRSVPPGAPPFTPPPLTGDRVWKTVELRPWGPVDEAAIAAMEDRLGSDLPPTYRRWLAENNGAAPVGRPCTCRGTGSSFRRYGPCSASTPTTPTPTWASGPVAHRTGFSATTS